MDQNPVRMAGQESPFHWVNGMGLSLRLQVFMIVRDDEGRIATVQLKEPEGYYWLPAETLRPNEPVKDAAVRVSESWFGVDLKPVVKDVITFQDEGNGKWYILHVFEAKVPEGGLPMLPDTAEIKMCEPGKAPGPFAMGHADVFPLIE